MTSLVALPNALSPRWCYASSGPSTPIVNITGERLFDQVFSYPNQSKKAPNTPTLLRVKCSGIMSTGILNLGMRMRVRLGGLTGTLIGDSGALTATASLSDSGWEAWMTGILTTAGGVSSFMELQGFVAFTGGLLSLQTLYMPNPSAISFDNTVDQDIAFTWQWTTASASNSTQMRVQHAEIDSL